MSSKGRSPPGRRPTATVPEDDHEDPDWQRSGQDVDLDDFLHEGDRRTLKAASTFQAWGDKTLDEVFDQRTLKSVYRLMSQGHLSTLEFPISTGKEGNVFLAHTEPFGSVAVKIYRRGTATFKHLQPYLQGDPRFRKLGRNRNRILSEWALKETTNLEDIWEATQRCPRPIARHENVIVMTYLGDEEAPARQLRNVPDLPVADLADDLMGLYRQMVQRARLIHADWSEYNLLWWGDRVWIIDVGQAITLSHPQAREFLDRDLVNLTRFLNRLGYHHNLDDFQVEMRSLLPE